MKKATLLFFLTICLLGCKTKQSIPTIVALSPTQQLIFLDSIQAAKAIVEDDMENFFGLVGILDMSIQMKQTFSEDVERETVVNAYKQFLKEDVLSFSAEEKVFIEKVFKRVLENANKVSTNIFGNEIRLVKTHAKHYGQSVFYTRENIIVIPKDVLEQRNEAAFYGTMLHELFHIYSRYHPKKRAALYELIGFKDIGPVSNLQFDPTLKKRILLNPDGVDFSYAIKLDIGEDQPVLAIPIILANTSTFNPGQPEFFSYLDFSLYKISPPYSKLIKVHSDPDGNTLLHPSQLADFYRQIKDNTQYIIHPDEIMADNFMYLISAQEDREMLNQYSEGGQELIADIEGILKGD